MIVVRSSGHPEQPYFGAEGSQNRMKSDASRVMIAVSKAIGLFRIDI